MGPHSDTLGEILADELQELGMKPRELAALLHIPANRLYQIVAGKRNMTADTNLRFRVTLARLRLCG